MSRDELREKCAALAAGDAQAAATLRLVEQAEDAEAVEQLGDWGEGEPPNPGLGTNFREYRVWKLSAQPAHSKWVSCDLTWTGGKTGVRSSVRGVASSIRGAAGAALRQFAAWYAPERSG